MSNYDFSQLSSYDFENLTCSLLQKEWGVRLEAFKSGRDQGIDLRYTSTDNKTTIIQCKHYNHSGFPKLSAVLRKEEAPKVSKLAPNRYVLVTSVGLTPQNKAEIKSILSPYVKVTSDIIGQTEINQLLESHPEVEQAHFKLWLTSKAVLDRVLHNAEHTQTDFAIERIQRMLPLYVENACYPRALNIIDSNNVVIISGVPGIGKTTLANILLYTHLSQGYTPVVIKSDLREGRNLYNKSTPQIFYYDDFLGQTFLRERHGFLLRNEDAALVDFIEMIQCSANAKLVMTTREHILTNALLASEGLRRSNVIDYRCVLNLSDYSRAEKARILYNHIYFSGLPEEYRKVLVEDKFYAAVFDHRNFNPRLIEWLASHRRTKTIAVENYQSFVRGVLEKPYEIWQDAFLNQISASARSLLLCLFTMGGKASLSGSELAWKALYNHQARKYNLQISAGEFRFTLKELEGAFVIIDANKIELLNPSVKDFISVLINESLDYIEDIVAASIYFDQILRLWQISQQPGYEQLRLKLFKAEAAIVDAMTRCLERPFAERIENPDGWVEKALDIYPLARLHGVILITDALKSEKAWTLASHSLSKILTYWQEDPPDFEAAVNVLSSLEKASWGKIKDEKKAYYELRSKMLDELPTKGFCEDFIQVEKYSKTSVLPFTNEENDKYSKAFLNYIDTRFYQEDWYANNKATYLQEMTDLLSTLLDDYGYSIQSEYNFLMEILVEWEMAGEREAEEMSERWRENEDIDKDDTDVIENMFGSLI